jgi:hypothetical protein
MDYHQACLYEMDFGKYRGKTLDDIGQTDNGLLYLDWLRGEVDRKLAPADKLLREALAAYLDDETIADEIKRLIDSGKGFPK